MKIQVLSPSDYRSMLWKNGKGTTTEIAIFPQGSSLQENDFQWRLSSAEISEDGLFSNFPGCQRYLGIIEGSGIHLEIDGKKEAIERDSVLQFSGEKTVHCFLQKGKVKDLNLIVKGGRVEAKFEILTEPKHDLRLREGLHLVFVASGTVALQVDGNPFLNIKYFETAVLGIERNETSFISVTPNADSRYAWIQIFTKDSP